MQAAGGIAISGLPTDLDWFNETYAPTGELVEGFPAYSAGDDRHLYREPKEDDWQISRAPFDPADTNCLAFIPAAGGPVPTGTRGWNVAVDDAWVDAELTLCEVA